MFDYGKCGCVELATGTMDFFLDRRSIAINDLRHLTRFAGAVSFSDDSDEGRDGTLVPQWGWAFERNLRVHCVSGGQRACLADWGGQRLLRREFWSLPSFQDYFTTFSDLADHIPEGTRPHDDELWHESAGSDWTVIGGALRLDTDGTHTGWTDYLWPNVTVTCYGHARSSGATGAEIGVLARGDGTIAGSINLHYSRATETATLSIYGSAVDSVTLTGQDPHYVRLILICDGPDISAKVLGINSGGTATGSEQTISGYTDPDYDPWDSPTKCGVEGTRATGEPVLFDRLGIPDPIVFDITVIGNDWTSLYDLTASGFPGARLNSQPFTTPYLLAPNVLLGNTAMQSGIGFPLTSTGTYQFLNEDGTVTTYNVIAEDDSALDAARSERETGEVAGLWPPRFYTWGYGLGILNDFDNEVCQLVAGDVVFPTSTAWPIVDGSLVLDSFGTNPTIRPDLATVDVSYECTPGGATLFWSWGFTSGHAGAGVFINGVNQVIYSTASTHDTLAGFCVSEGYVAVIVSLTSGGREFRIYDETGLIYSNAHATRWASALIRVASDRWFYVNDVANWSGFTTEEPASVSGSPPSTIDMLISVDGSQRVRACYYQTGYEDSGAPGPTGINTVDCVKIAGTLPYDLPATINYPA